MSRAYISPTAISRARWRLASMKLEVGFLRAIVALKAGFDPSQPRIPAGQEGGGRWTWAGGSNWAEGSGWAEEATWAREGTAKDNEVVRVAARRISPSREAECERLHDRDIFQCNMVGLRSCYQQATARLAACRQGHPLPPFVY